MVLLQVTLPKHNNGHRDKGLSLPQSDHAERTCIPCSSAYLLRDTFQHPRGGSWRPSLPGVWMWPDTAHQLAGRALPVRGLMTPQPAGRQREGSSQPRIKDLARQGSSHSSLQIHCLGCPRGGDVPARAEIRGRRQKEKLGFYGGARRTGFRGPPRMNGLIHGRCSRRPHYMVPGPQELWPGECGAAPADSGDGLEPSGEQNQQNSDTEAQASSPSVP